MSFLRSVSRASKSAAGAIALACLATSVADAQITSTVIVNDSFANGFSDLSADGSELDVFASGSLDALSADRTVAGPIDFASGDASRAIHGLFPVQTLTNVGDSLEVTFDFTTPATVAGSTTTTPASTNEDFRFGLFFTGGAAGFDANIEADTTTPSALLNSLAGFAGEIDNINTGLSSDLGIRTHNVNGLVPSNAGTSSTSLDGTPSGILLNTNGAFDQIDSDSANGLITLPANTDFTGRLLVRLSDSSLETIDITIQILDASGAVVDSLSTTAFVNDQADGTIGVNTLSFDFLGISATGGAFGAAGVPGEVGVADNGVDISNVTITFGTAVPTVIVNDSFANGFSDLSADGSELNVFTSSSLDALSTDPTASGPIDFATGSSGRAIHGLFPAQTLGAVGDNLEVTFDFVTPATIAGSATTTPASNNEDFRFGLFFTGGAAGFDTNFTANAGVPSDLLNSLAGFAGEIDNINTGASSDLGIRTHNVNGLDPSNAAGTPSGVLLNTNNGFDQIDSDSPNGLVTLTPNTAFSGRMFVELNDPSLETVDITVQIRDASGSVIDSLSTTAFVDDQADGTIGVNTLTFDFLGIAATGGAFGAFDAAGVVGVANNGVDITNVTISSLIASEFLLGDVNLDGAVDFLDIAPFITLLSTGEFQAEADTNEDGVVDFLDIAPFIVLLST